MVFQQRGKDLVIMRDVNSGWLIRYTHANVASFFFIFVYAHIGRNLYYGSYKSPRVLPYSIGVIILILMMAKFWPNCNYDLNFTLLFSTMLPINRARTKALLRIGPHNKDILDLIICGLLGDFWADSIQSKTSVSTRIKVEQSISNSAYIHHLTLYFYNLGYCSNPVPVLVKKQHLNIENTFNYRLTLFTFSSFNWIFDSFYKHIKSPQGIIKTKIVPLYISEYLSPIGLAHWIMQYGSRQKGQGVSIATNSFTLEECKFLANILNNKYGLVTSVTKSGTPNQFRINIWKRSMPTLINIINPYIIPEMLYKINS